MTNKSYLSFLGYYQIVGSAFLAITALVLYIDEFLMLLMLLIVVLINIIIGISLIMKDPIGKIGTIINLVIQIPICYCIDSFSFSYSLIFDFSFLFHLSELESIANLSFNSIFYMFFEDCTNHTIGISIVPLLLLLGMFRKPRDEKNPPFFSFDTDGSI